MNNEFIPYEQALELKELGFNEECIGWYPNNSAALSLHGVFIGKPSSGSYKLLAYAPLYQQAFRWFREKYDSSYWVQKDWEEGNFLGYEGTIEYPDGFRYCGTFNTYEEAELACLKKLIEIIKNK